MNKHAPRFALTAGSLALLTAAATAEGPVPYESGRFRSGDQSVFQGTFGGSLGLDVLTLGEGTFEARRNDFVVPIAARAMTDIDASGDYTLLSDEQLRAGDQPWAIAFGRDMENHNIGGLVDALGRLDLGSMLYAGGTHAGRVDLLLPLPMYDNIPGMADALPEVVLVAGLTGAPIKVTAIVGGTLEAPVLAPRSMTVTPVMLASGETGITMLTNRTATPQRIAAVGFDLSGDLHLLEGQSAIGLRVEVPTGSDFMFSVMGAMNDATLAQVEHDIEPEMDEPAEAATGDVGGGGGGGGGGGYGSGGMRSRASLVPYRRKEPRGFMGYSNSSSPGRPRPHFLPPPQPDAGGPDDGSDDDAGEDEGTDDSHGNPPPDGDGDDSVTNPPDGGDDDKDKPREPKVGDVGGSFDTEPADVDVGDIMNDFRDGGSITDPPAGAFRAAMDASGGLSEHGPGGERHPIGHGAHGDMGVGNQPVPAPGAMLVLAAGALVSRRRRSA